MWLRNSRNHAGRPGGPGCALTGGGPRWERATGLSGRTRRYPQNRIRIRFKSCLRRCYFRRCHYAHLLRRLLLLPALADLARRSRQSRIRIRPKS